MATDLKKVWMVGDSWVHWLMQYCKELGIAKHLGLQDVAVSWFGQRGMQWGDVFVRLHSLESHKHPQVIVIHCGGNDLGKMRGVALIRRMKDDLKHFAEMFPHTTFVLSTIAQRQKWVRRTEFGYKLDKARRKVMFAYSRDMGMLVFGHTNIVHQDQTVFRKDGVHLTPKGPVYEKIRKDLFTDTFCKVCGAVLFYESQRISHYEGKRHAQKVNVYFQMYSEQDPEEMPDPEKKPKVESLNFQMDGNDVSDKNKFCSLCNMVFSSAVVAQSHYVGKNHAKKLKLSNGEPTLNWPPLMPSTPPRSVEKETGTKVSADASDSSDQPKQDVKIDLHSLTVINTEDPDKYCKLCCAQFNNPLMAKQHYIGKRHGRNKHRKRMMEEMEEMEDEGVISDSSTSAVAVSTYACPVCSLTFVSMEMYQSHIQVAKHIKENIVVSVLKNTKKAYDSFQDELADYIKVQKSRGLEPKTNARKSGDIDDGDDGEGKDDRASPAGFVPERIPTFDRARTYPQNCSRPSRSRLPYRTPVQRNYYRGRLVQHGPLRPRYYPEPERKLPAAFKLDTSGPKRVHSNDRVHYTSSDDSSDSYHKERRHKKKRRKEKRHKKSADPKKHHRHASKKRRKSSDDTDSEMEDLSLKPKEKVVEPTHEDNVKEEEKECKEELPVENEIKKHKREKKKKVIDPRTEEEKLWDESILGF